MVYYQLNVTKTTQKNHELSGPSYPTYPVNKQKGGQLHMYPVDGDLSSGEQSTF